LAIIITEFTQVFVIWTWALLHNYTCPKHKTVETVFKKKFILQLYENFVNPVRSWIMLNLNPIRLNDQFISV